MFWSASSLHISAVVETSAFVALTSTLYFGVGVNGGAEGSTIAVSVNYERMIALFYELNKDNISPFPKNEKRGKYLRKEVLQVCTPSKPQTTILPGTEKLNKPPRQTKSPNNSNVLHMFINNTYTDFRTAYEHVLIPSYVIQVI